MFFDSSPVLSIGWDTSVGATYYEWEALWVDPDPFVVVGSGTVTTTEVAIPRPKPGHIAFKVRACNEASLPPCGDWCYSTDKNCSVEIIPDAPYKEIGWLIYWRLEAPTGVGER